MTQPWRPFLLVFFGRYIFLLKDVKRERDKRAIIMSVPNGFGYGWQVALSLVTCFYRLFTTGERTALSDFAFVVSAFWVAGRTMGVLVVVKGGCPRTLFFLKHKNKIIYLCTLSDLQCMSKTWTFFPLPQQSSRPTHISLNGFSTKNKHIHQPCIATLLNEPCPMVRKVPVIFFFFSRDFFCCYFYIHIFLLDWIISGEYKPLFLSWTSPSSETTLSIATFRKYANSKMRRA